MDVRKNEKVNVDGPRLVIDTFYGNGHRIEGKTFDFESEELRKYRGKLIRVWVDLDYKLTIEQGRPQYYWLLVEILVPRIKAKYVDTDEKDEEGNPIRERVELPLTLTEDDYEPKDLPPTK